MLPEAEKPDLDAEAAALAKHLAEGDPQASIHLARLIDADSKLALQLFGRVLSAKVRDHVYRWAELGVTDPEVTVDQELYRLLKVTSTHLLTAPEKGEEKESG